MRRWSNTYVIPIEKAEAKTDKAVVAFCKELKIKRLV